MTILKQLLSLLVGVSSIYAASPACADPVEDFYKGRTVTVLIGAPPGGSYDLVARVLVAHIGRFIPGNPLVIPKNMPGAGQLLVTNYLYNVAPKDGTVFGSIARGSALEPLIGDQNGARFDGSKMTWIGSATDEVSLCVTYGTSSVKTWNDALAKDFTVGGNGPGADADTFSNVLRNLFGVKSRLITGYPGTSEIALAMERGEIDGRCGWSWSSIKAERPNWVKEGKLNLLVQLTLTEGAPDLPGVPVITGFAKDERLSRILKLIFSRQIMGRPFVGPPGIPEERTQALRRAFDLTMADPEFLRAAQQRSLEINPVTGLAIQKLIAEIYDTPKEIIEEVRNAVSR
jgi:tripartite-type tricarboxylate transporter receptor subunit TctC